MELYILLPVILTLSALIWYVRRPFLAILKLKLKFGKDVHIKYNFPIGEFAIWQNSLKKHNDNMKEYRDLIQQNKNIKFIVGNIFTEPYIQVIDPTYTKLMFTEHQNYEKYEMYGSDLLVKQGLVFTSGHQWKRQRSLLGGSFEFSKLKARVPMINQVVKDTLKSQDYTERTLDLTTQIAGTVVVNSFFGQNGMSEKINGNDPISEIVSIFCELNQMENTSFIFLKQLFLGPKTWNYFLTQREKKILRRINLLKDFSRNIIQNRIENPKKDATDFLDVYVNEYNKNANEIAIEEIIHQFITLFFAGTDTTSHSTYICLYFLSAYPDAQQDIFNEIKAVIGDGDINDEHITKLPIMSAFISEVFRLRNPALCPIVRIVQQTHYIKDLKLEKDWLVIPAIHLVQISPDHYEDPLVFNYKRYLNKQCLKDDNGFVNIPFSAGGRNCIGQHMAQMEMKIILANIIRQYKVTLNEKAKVRWDFKFLYSFEPQNAVKLIERQ